LLPAAIATAAAPDTDALIARLARPAPASVRFTEARFSSLLREPLVVSGELGYSGPASLDRRVETPYHETTTIRGDSVRVEREGEAPRSFALKRAPELQGLLTGFSALLTGDAAALHRSFDVAASGSDESWSLVLKPSDPRARRRLQQITIDGRSDMPRCFSILTPASTTTSNSNAPGTASIMLLGDAASAQLPQDLTPDALAGLCRAE
jgi:Outer membrane lipoprotein carrier protein LolA-like